MNIKETFHRPEYLLASRITVSVLLALLGVMAAAASFGWLVDGKRVEDFFEKRVEMLANRKSELPLAISKAERPELEIAKSQERGFGQR